MTVTKMNHAMLSFGLLGGMLVSPPRPRPAPTPKPQKK
jgi:hypothetical protein